MIKSTKRKRVLLELNYELYEPLRDLCFDKRISVSEYLREALKEKMSNEILPDKKPESLIEAQEKEIDFLIFRNVHFSLLDDSVCYKFVCWIENIPFRLYTITTFRDKSVFKLFMDNIRGGDDLTGSFPRLRSIYEEAAKYDGLV